MPVDRCSRRHGESQSELAIHTWSLTPLGLALVTARARHGSGAATLHGAAEAIHAKLGTRFVAVESRLQHADIVALRMSLGDETFERAYDDGRHAGRGVS